MCPLETNITCIYIQKWVYAYKAACQLFCSLLLICFQELNCFHEISVWDSQKILPVCWNSKLQTRLSIFQNQNSKLEPRNSILDSQKLQRSRIELRVKTVNLLLLHEMPLKPYASKRVWKGGPDPTFPLHFHENPTSCTSSITFLNRSFFSQKNTFKSLISKKS